MGIDFSINRRGLLRSSAVAALAVGASLLGKNFATATPAKAAPAGGKKIAKLSTVKIGSTKKFTSVSGEPSVLFRTNTGVFAYSAVCTHQGCTVAYKASSKHLFCSCHGAEFDPAQDGKAIVGPANTPLSKINVTVKGAWIVEI